MEAGISPDAAVAILDDDDDDVDDMDEIHEEGDEEGDLRIYEEVDDGSDGPEKVRRDYGLQGWKILFWRFSEGL